MSQSMILDKLWKLAKNFQKKEFVKIINTTNVMEQYNTWSNLEIAVMLYSFNRLNLGNPQTWDQFAKMYLSKDRDMTFKDHIMCGWAFINKETNQELKLRITNNILKNSMNIKNSQDQESNLGIISYMLSYYGIQDQITWSKISWMVLNSIEQQNHKNYSLIVYSFAKQEFSDPDFWKVMERQLWNLDFEVFNQRQRMMILFSFSKMKAGSSQFWKKMEMFLEQIDVMTQQDINFACWSLARAEKNNQKAWKNLIRMIDANQASIIDYDLVAWGLEWVFKNERSDEVREIWDQFFELKYPRKQIYKPIQEVISIIYISSQIKMCNLQESSLIQNMSERFKVLVNQFPLEFLHLKRRLYSLKNLIEYYPDTYNDKFHQLLCQKIKQESQIYQFLYICDGILLAQLNTDFNYTKDYIELFLNINQETQKQQTKKYTTTLLKLIDKCLAHQEYEYANKLIPLLNQEFIFDSLNERIISCGHIFKLLIEQNEISILLNFMEYLKSKRKISKGVFLRLLFTILNKHQCYLTGQVAEQFLSEAAYIYENTLDNTLIEQKQLEFEQILDGLIYLLNQKPMNYANLKVQFKKYFNLELDVEGVTIKQDEMELTFEEVMKAQVQHNRNKEDIYDNKHQKIEFYGKLLGQKIERYFIK